MKKSLWMFAAAMTCGLALTSCERVDNAVAPGPDVPPVENPSSELSLDFEGEDVPEFQILQDNRLSYEVIDDATLGSKVLNFKCGSNGGIAFASFDISEVTKKATKVNFSCDFNISEVAGQGRISLADANIHNGNNGGFTAKNNWGYGNNGAIFHIGADRGKIGGSNVNYFAIDGEAKAVNNEEYEVQAADMLGSWLHLDVTVDMDNRLVDYTLKKGDEVVFAGEALPFINDAAVNCSQIDVYFANTGNLSIDNLQIKTEDDPNVTFADYTVRFVDENGNDVKEPQVRNGKVGAAVNLLPADTQDFNTEDGSEKYSYQSNNAEGLVIKAEGTEVQVVFAAAQKVTYRLNYRTDDGTRFAYDDKVVFAGDKLTVHYKAAYVVDGKLYITPVMDDGGKGYQGRYYNFTGTEVISNRGRVEGNIEYAPAPENIIYMAEVEDLAEAGNLNGEVTSWISFNNQPFARFSQGRGIKLADGGYVWTDALPAGTYSISFYGRCDANSGCTSPVIAIRDAEGNLTPVEAEVADWGGAEMGSRTFAGVNVPEGCSIAIIWGGTGANVSLDTITVFIPEEAE